MRSGAAEASGSAKRYLMLSSRAPPQIVPEAHAFFLDVDGTLLDFASQPDLVRGDAELLDLLKTIAVRSTGALALVSGRNIDDLDRIMAPCRFAAAGVHGFERRDATGASIRRAPLSPEVFKDARRALEQFVSAHPEVVLEDKHAALAVHYRAAPQHEAAVMSTLERSVKVPDADLTIQRGAMVAELLPRGVSKGQAVAEFMAEAPFKGRIPLYIGDDLTDESAFEWVNEARGLSITVGARRPTAAHAVLQSVAAVRAWLRGLVSHNGPGDSPHGR